MTGPASRPAVVELQVADEPQTWRALGFTVTGDVARVGPVAVRLLGSGVGTGIVGWTLRDWDGAPLDGLATAPAPAGPAPAGAHPNTATGVDHVVVATPDRERTSAALDAAGLGLRRVRTGVTTPQGTMEQAFHRAGPVIVEVVGPAAPASADRAAFWGVTFVVDDLDAAVRVLGEHAGTVRDAVQPGRRIVTVRRQAGSSVPLAFISA